MKLISKQRLVLTFADTLQSTPDGFVDRGIVMAEGDGTVNLLSSGYMCNRGWQIKRYNPANISVVAIEMPHEPDRFDPRGGPNTGDHVDILGRRELNDLILRVAGGKGHLIKESIVSDIKQYSARVKIYDDDEDPSELESVAALKIEDLKESISDDMLPENASESVSHVERLLDEL